MTALAKSSARSRLTLFLAGIFVLQAVWVLAVPPFRGSDEFDHAYRAAGVASGQWLLTDKAPDGRRILVDVPASLVQAARGQCEELPYTDTANCRGLDERTPGTVAVVTGAGPYNPLFYWVTGTAAQPFEGDAALYAMRVAAALMCFACLAAAVATVLSQRPGRWELTGLVVSLTPVLVYSTAVAAPNGLEMCAGLLLWATLLGVVGGRRPDLERRYVAGAAAATVLLTFLRLLGPVWIGCIVVVVLVHAGRAGTLRAVRAHARALAAATAAALVALAGAAAWVLASNGTTSAGTGTSLTSPVTEMLEQTVVWIAQLVASFPYRDQFAPMAAYPLYLIPVVTGLVVSLKRGSGRQRLAVLTAVLLTVAVPIALTVTTVESQGLVWQGRYALPFVAGVVLLVGRVLDDSGWAPREGARLAAIALVMLGIAWVVSVHRVVARELGIGASVDGGWVHPPLAVLDVLCGLGFAVLAWAAWSSPPRQEQPPAPARTTAEVGARAR